MTMYEFDTDFQFNFRTLASVALNLRCNILVKFENGRFGNIGLDVTTNADSTTAVSDTSGTIGKQGKVVGLFVHEPAGGTVVRRGQVMVHVDMGITTARTTTLASGYYNNENRIALDRFENPLSGKGHLHWVQEEDDVAGNVTATVNLAQTNTHRIVRAVIVKYHASNDAASRTLTITLRDLATAAGPTGWSIASDTYVSPTLTLTADEEGLFHIGEHGFVSVNDAGTLTYADNASNPNPFPLELEDGETADLIIVAGAGEAADDYDVWVQYEDWIEV